MNRAVHLPFGVVDMSWCIAEAHAPDDLIYYHVLSNHFLANHTMGVRCLVERGEVAPRGVVSLLLLEVLSARAEFLDFDVEQARAVARRILLAADDVEAACAVALQKQGGAA